MGGGPHRAAGTIDSRGTRLDRLILDTTILITAERRGQELDEIIADEDDVAIAAISAAELLVGVELADRKHKRRRTKLVEAVLSAVHVEDYDLRVARAHTKLLGHVHTTGSVRGAHDLIIAATAVSTRRIVVTADPAGFESLPDVSARSA